MRLRHLGGAIILAPLLGDLAPLYAVHGHGRHHYLFVPWHQAKVLPSIVGAAPGDAGDDLVASGYLVLDSGADIREGSVLFGDLLLVALTARLLSLEQAMIDEVRGEQFVYGVQVSPAYRFPKAAHQGLVVIFLRRHGSFLLVAYSRFSNQSINTHDAT